MNTALQHRNVLATIVALGAIATASPATAATLKITVENIGPVGGGVATPLWFGFHDGSFNTFDAGAPASPGIEHIAEDGFTGLENNLPVFENVDFSNFIIPPDETIASIFSNSSAGNNGGVQGILSSQENPIFGFFPGQTNSVKVKLNGNSANHRFFSYAAMYFPSNDAFIADENPIEIFDSSGKFIGTDFIIAGNQVWDAGTEINDEDFSNVPFTLAEVAQGNDENGTIQLHAGFQPRGTGGVLDFISSNGIPIFANADFTAPNYQVARIKVEKVPEPSTVVSLLAVGGFLFLSRRLRRTVS